MSRLPLIVLPGWGMPSSVWERLLPDLEDDFQPFCVEWHGVRDKDGFYRHAVSLIQRHSLERFSLMGWSMGSLVALKIAALCRSRVDNVILFGATSQFTRDGRETDSAGWPKRVVERMKRQLVQNRTQTLETFYDSMFSGEEKENGHHRVFTGRIRNRAQSYSLGELVAGLDYLIGENLREDLRFIESPMLLIHGDSDQICPADASRIIATGAGGPVRLEILDKTGHVPFFTKPKQCLSAIREMVKR